MGGALRPMANRDVERYFGNPEVLLAFMRRTRKPVFHKSNIFFRDIQYAIRDYFDTVQGSPVTVPQAERMAQDVVELYTEVGILRKVNNQAYVLDSLEFATPKGGTYSMLTLQGTPLPGEAVLSMEPASGAPETPHADPQAGTDNRPNPKVEHHVG
jgi:hypothetical protein